MDNTTYLDIVEMVTSLLKSYELDAIYDTHNEEGLITMLRPYIKYAAGELSVLDSGIDMSRDDSMDEFDNPLSDAEQLLIAKYVLIGYLTRDKNDILQMRLHLQDGDFKTFAEANNLNAKSSALEQLKEEVAWDVKKIGYRDNNVWA